MDAARWLNLVNIEYIRTMIYDSTMQSERVCKRYNGEANTEMELLIILPNMRFPAKGANVRIIRVR